MKVCKIEGCERVYVAKGFCKKHYDAENNKTEKRKTQLSRYQKSDKGKILRRKREQSKGYKIKKKKYQESEHGKELRDEYQKTEAFKVMAKKSNQRECRKKYARILSKTSYKYRDRDFNCVVPDCTNDHIHLHHGDYDKPYEVVPLCVEHHRELHRERKVCNQY